MSEKNTIELILRKEHGETRLANYNEVKSRIEELSDSFGEVVYTADTLAAARRDRATLNRAQNSLERTRARLKELIRSCERGCESYASLCREEEKVEALISMIERPRMLVREFIEYCEEEQIKSRRRELMRIARSGGSVLGDYAGLVLSSPAFWDSRWDDTTVSTKRCIAEIKSRLSDIALNIASLKNQPCSSALILRYIETLKLDSVDAYRQRLEAVERGSLPDFSFDDNVRGYKLLKIEGREKQLDSIISELELIGAEFTIVEDGMPMRPVEKKEPDFDSFVAFDLETSGSLGSASGDLPAKITEIGAVKVENGVITARFSELCNPGRPITPTVAELTGITDEMVAQKPPVGEILRRFVEFVGDAILVGHGIKNSDMKFLESAARFEGIALENLYFDTFLYAKRVKERIELDGLGLEALAKQLGVIQSRAHRALADAETAAGVYFALRELMP